LVHAGEVQRLVEGALVHRSIAEEAHRHIGAVLIADGERGAGGDTEAAAHDAVRPEHADGEVGHMHRAAPAAAGAGGLAVQLGEHGAERDALRDGVAVTAMGRRDVVGRGEVTAHSHRGGLLARAGVHEAGQFAGLEQLFDARLEGTDGLHPAQQVASLCRIERRIGDGGGHGPSSQWLV
jgi:hypothetical protein